MKIIQWIMILFRFFAVCGDEDDEWTSWTRVKIGKCSVTCGIGLREMHYRRHCEKPVIRNQGIQCKGHYKVVVTIYCETFVHCPVDGGWSTWIRMKDRRCSCKTNRSLVTFERTCTNPEPRYDGHICLGKITKNVSLPCKPNCPVILGWSSWTRLRVLKCSVTCGVGIREVYYRRTCQNNRLEHHKLVCKGLFRTYKTELCDTEIRCFARVSLP